MLTALLPRFRRRPDWAATPPPERDADFYTAGYARKTVYQLPYHLSPYFAVWTVIADRVRQAQATRVLEVGCGAGQLAALLLDNGLASYTGFDFSPGAVALARTHAPTGTFHVADALTTDLVTQPVDLILCTEVLEHIDRDRDLIGRWPSGTHSLCTVPDFPGKAHVRHFTSEAAVRARYGDLFRDLSVVTIRKPTEKPGRYFLLDGVRH